MKITNISVQARNQNRVNVSVDGKFRFSLDLFQLSDLGLKIGSELTEKYLVSLEIESQFGKLYARALDYVLVRPRSLKEVRDYLWKKTRDTRYRARDGSIKERPGVSQDVADRVFSRLVEKGHIDDEKFARFWIDRRNRAKGISSRKLTMELRHKGIDADMINICLGESDRDDSNEIQKIISKKYTKYSDENKLVAYLARQGFSYDDIKQAISDYRSSLSS
ncbi:RecX family transcriptional regulator [Candidatus Nomurabacteria bacterium]|nr:RecX family transcriptional regulator [Candidatus Nomurabacteria bacterium]